MLSPMSPESVKSKVRDLPNKPGVYLMRDRLGRVIYVGKVRSYSIDRWTRRVLRLSDGAGM